MYGKFTSAKVYPEGLSFTASNGWLEKWNRMYDVREKRFCGEADEVSTTIVQARIKRLRELCQDHKVFDGRKSAVFTKYYLIISIFHNFTLLNMA